MVKRCIPLRQNRVNVENLDNLNTYLTVAIDLYYVQFHSKANLDFESCFIISLHSPVKYQELPNFHKKCLWFKMYKVMTAFEKC